MTPIAVVLVATLVASRQAHPDFAGRWTLDTPSPPLDAARVLVVEQAVTRTNVRGEPTPPTYLHLSARREEPSGTTSDTYTIGMSSGVVGGIDRNGKRTAPSAYFETVWRGDALTFLTRRDGPDGPHTGDWSERSESWSLDADGHLRVEIETEAHDRAQQRTVLHYHR
ncbi:MAG TPA: hypothetical protein VH138_02565, partial [Vicinamibacterales bacterium]|nr:hypothetical protein [Vicinamibacterales bacterium]